MSSATPADSPAAELEREWARGAARRRPAAAGLPSGAGAVALAAVLDPGSTAEQLVAVDVRQLWAPAAPGQPRQRALDVDTARLLEQFEQIMADVGPALARPGPRYAWPVATPQRRAQHVTALRLLLQLRALQVPWRRLATAGGRSDRREAGRQLHQRLSNQVLADLAHAGGP